MAFVKFPANWVVFPMTLPMVPMRVPKDPVIAGDTLLMPLITFEVILPKILTNPEISKIPPVLALALAETLAGK